MIHDLILDIDDLNRLNKPINEIHAHKGVISVILINLSGRNLTSVGDVNEFEAQTISALVAGTFSSIITIVDVIRDRNTPKNNAGNTRKKIQISLPSGNRSIHIALVDDNTFLATIFDNTVSLDLVKAKINESTTELNGILKTFYSKMESGPEINLDLGAPDWNV